MAACLVKLQPAVYLQHQACCVGALTRVLLPILQGITGGVRAARGGHDVIMTPTSHCYFDYKQSLRWEAALQAVMHSTCACGLHSYLFCKRIAAICSASTCMSTFCSCQQQDTLFFGCHCLSARGRLKQPHLPAECWRATLAFLAAGLRSPGPGMPCCPWRSAMPLTLCPLSRCLTRGVRLRRPCHQLSTQLRHQCA